MNKIKHILLAGALLVSFGQNAHSQKDSSTYNESVIVVGDYNPVLDGVTEKVNVAPTVNDEVDSDLQPKFNYSITPRRITSQTSTTGLKAAKVIASPTRLYNNYVRFGLGHDFADFRDFNPLVDLYYMSTRKEEMSYGVRFYHQTDVTTFGHDDGGASPEYWGRDRQSDTKLDLFGKYILNKKHLFNANLLFDRQYGRYYGFSDSTLAAHGLVRDNIEYSDYAYAYNNVASSISAKSLNIEEGKLGYDANWGFGNMWSKWNTKEFYTNIDGGVHYGFQMFDKYKALAHLRASMQYFSNDGDAVTSINDLPIGFDPSLALDPEYGIQKCYINVNPSIDLFFKDLKVHLGLALGLNNDRESSFEHNLFPDIVVVKSFMNNDMSLTLGFQGGYLYNDVNSLRQINPFIDPRVSTVATVDDNLYAHLRFNFSKKLMLKVNVDNHFYENKLFFKPSMSYQLGNIYTAYFVDANNMELGAEFSFVNDEMLSVNLGANYYLYYNEPDNQPLLYAPDFSAHLGADVNYKDKWLGHMQLLFFSGMDAEYNPVSPQHEITKTLPARFGVSFGVEYIYSRALSFFANLDNVTCQRYYLWANYPSQRINAMLGLTYTFPKLLSK